VRVAAPSANGAARPPDRGTVPAAGGTPARPGADCAAAAAAPPQAAGGGCSAIVSVEALSGRVAALPAAMTAQQQGSLNSGCRRRRRRGCWRSRPASRASWSATVATGWRRRTCAARRAARCRCARPRSGCSCWPPPCGMLGQHIMLCFINRDVGDRQSAALCALLHLPVVSGVQDMCRHCGMVETRWHVAGCTRTQGGTSAPDVDEAAADGSAGLLDRAPVGCAAVSVHHVERVPAAVVHRIRLHLQTRAPPVLDQIKSTIEMRRRLAPPASPTARVGSDERPPNSWGPRR